MVRERGLEPPPLTGPDPKSGASAISPLALAEGRQNLAQYELLAIFNGGLDASPRGSGAEAESAPLPERFIVGNETFRRDGD